MIAGSPNLSNPAVRLLYLLLSRRSSFSFSCSQLREQQNVTHSKTKEIQQEHKGPRKIESAKAYCTLFCLTTRPMFVSHRFLSAFKKKEILIFLLVTEVGRGSGIQHMCSSQWIIHHHSVFNSFSVSCYHTGNR